MIATIKITDTPENGKCQVEIHFDPPLKKESDSQAQRIAMICLNAIKQRAEGGFKQVTIGELPPTNPEERN